MATFHQLNCMRSFLAVSEAGSFSRAAHAMQIGAASVSEHVASLERHLNVALFHRTTRSLRLTHEGARYLALCRDVLPRIEELDTGLARSGRSEALSGLLRVEMSDGMDAFLLDALDAFQDQHPAVAIHLRRSLRPFDLAEPHADIVIRAIAPRGQAATRILGQSRTTFLAAPAYLERMGMPETPDDLLRHDCIGYVDPASGRLWEWYFAGADGGMFALDLPCTLAFSEGDLRRRAAVNGRGIINDIAAFTDALVRQGALVPLLPDWSMPQPLCHIGVPRDRHASPRIAAFIDHLEQWLASRPAGHG